MALAASDLRLLNRILELGHSLEKEWPSPRALQLLEELKTRIRDAQEAKSEDLKRLSFHERDLTQEMSAQHLSAILVPFERLHGKSLRDDDFLVSTVDKPAAQRRSDPLVVLAENIRSSFNVGAIFRTSESFGAEEVVLCGYSPTPDDLKTAKTSLGTEQAIPWRSAPLIADEIRRLKNDGYRVVALETSEKAVSIDEFKWPEKTVLVLGNERFGVDHATLSSADHLVKIPMYGAKNSLNVGIACGIALAAWRRDHENIFTAKPVGTFHSTAKNKYEARRQGVVNETGEVGFIELETKFTDALKDLEGFEKVWLVYEFDRNRDWKPMVLPPRGPAVKRGVFATRSPYRPNAIGLSAVDLVEIQGTTLFVSGHDLLDGTPILDIKPYLPYADAFPDAKAGWTEGLDTRRFAVSFSEKAKAQLDWIERQGIAQLRPFLVAQLEFDPTDIERKRVRRADARLWTLAYRTWRADFEPSDDDRSLEVVRIHSGYSASDLDSSDDPYGDKDVHRNFMTKFE